MVKIRRSGSHARLRRIANPSPRFVGIYANVAHFSLFFPSPHVFRVLERIPIEVWYYIVDWLAIIGTHDDLKTCSLVCHDWTSLSQRHLHREITMVLADTQTDLKRYSSNVSRHVKHLSVEFIDPEQHSQSEASDGETDLDPDSDVEEGRYGDMSEQFQAFRFILLRLTRLMHLTLVFTGSSSIDPREWTDFVAPLTLTRIDLKGFRFKYSTLSLSQFLSFFPSLTCMELADITWKATSRDNVRSLSATSYIAILRNLRCLSLAPASVQDDMKNWSEILTDVTSRDFHEDFTLKLALPFVSTLTGLHNLLSAVGPALKHVRLGHNFLTSTSTDQFSETCKLFSVVLNFYVIHD